MPATALEAYLHHRRTGRVRRGQGRAQRRRPGRRGRRRSRWLTGELRGPGSALRAVPGDRRRQWHRPRRLRQAHRPPGDRRRRPGRPPAAARGARRRGRVPADGPLADPGLAPTLVLTVDGELAPARGVGAHGCRRCKPWPPLRVAGSTSTPSSRCGSGVLQCLVEGGVEVLGVPGRRPRRATGRLRRAARARRVGGQPSTTPDRPLADAALAPRRRPRRRRRRPHRVGRLVPSRPIVRPIRRRAEVATTDDDAGARPVDPEPDVTVGAVVVADDARSGVVVAFGAPGRRPRADDGGGAAPVPLRRTARRLAHGRRRHAGALRGRRRRPRPVGGRRHRRRDGRRPSRRRGRRHDRRRRPPRTGWLIAAPGQLVVAPVLSLHGAHGGASMVAAADGPEGERRTSPRHATPAIGPRLRQRDDGPAPHGQARGSGRAAGVRPAVAERAGAADAVPVRTDAPAARARRLPAPGAARLRPAAPARVRPAASARVRPAAPAARRMGSAAASGGGPPPPGGFPPARAARRRTARRRPGRRLHAPPYGGLPTGPGPGGPERRKGGLIFLIVAVVVVLGLIAGAVVVLGQHPYSIQVHDI